MWILAKISDFTVSICIQLKLLTYWVSLEGEQTNMNKVMMVSYPQGG
jgi:hypothetical protein